MRWTLGVVALLFLAGCASDPPAVSEADLTAAADPAQAPDAGNTTLLPLRFAGGDREASMPIEFTFAPTENCILGFTECPFQRVDLTPLIPVDAPVELSVTLDSNTNTQGGVSGNDAVSFVMYSQERDQGQVRIHALLVRSADGVVELALGPIFPSADQMQSGGRVTGTAHTIARADVVPAYVPVAVQLGPGDVVEARGGGLEQLVVFPPSGDAIRITTAPFQVELPADAPAGQYFLFAEADEAVRMAGPNATLVAHRLVYLEGDPVDVPMAQPTTWPLEIPGFPLIVGIEIESKRNVPDCCGVASYMGPRHVKMTTPANVDVLVEDVDCLPLMGCPLNPIGTSSNGYNTEFLDEHLVPGTYTASVLIDQANNMQAYAWAVYIV